MSEFPKVKSNTYSLCDVETEEGVLVARCSRFGGFKGKEVARRITALLNATAHLTIEQLESDDPLDRETACREQREAEEYLSDQRCDDDLIFAIRYADTPKLKATP